MQATRSALPAEHIGRSLPQKRNIGSPITLKRATASDATCGSSTAGWSAAYDAQVILSKITLQNNYVTIDGVVPSGILLNLANSSGSPSAIVSVVPQTA